MISVEWKRYVQGRGPLLPLPLTGRDHVEIFVRTAPRIANPSCWSPSPSPSPQPLGRGRHTFRFSEQGDAADWRRTGGRFSLSLGERAGVRGKGTFEFQEGTHSKSGSRAKRCEEWF